MGCYNSFSQSRYWANSTYPDSLTSVGTHFHVDYNGSSFTNSFLSHFVFGSYIPNSEIDAMNNRMSPINNIGLDAMGQLFYMGKSKRISDTSSYRFGISVNSVQHDDASLSKELISLIFKGNYQYLNKTVNFGSNTFQNLSYDNIMLHLFHKTKYKGSVQTLRLGLGLILGKNYNSLNIDNASIYTKFNGEYLDLKAKYKYIEINNSSRYYNGYGLNFESSYTIETKKNIFNMFIMNSGNIRWVNNSKTVSKDTSYRFDGLDLANTLQIAKKINSDSLLPLYAGRLKDTNHVTTSIIPEIYLTFEHKIGSSFGIEVGADFKLTVNYQPLISGKMKCYLKNNSYFAFDLNYGGYSVVNYSDKKPIAVGVEALVNQSKRWNIFLKIPYLNALIAPNKYLGGLFYITIAKQI